MFPFGLIKIPDLAEVDWDGNNVENSRSSPCWAAWKADADGDKYNSANDGGYSSSYKTWLTLGLNSQVWVERTINSGTFARDFGAARVIMTADRELGIFRSTSGTDNGNATVRFYDAASGGNLLATGTLTLQATRT